MVASLRNWVHWIVREGGREGDQASMHRCRELGCESGRCCGGGAEEEVEELRD